jgi:hypothetical protein
MPFQQSQTRMVDLPEILGEIDDGLVGLPDFQRDFDWTKADVVKLLVTVLKGWPAGSLLLMHGRAKFFEVRGLEGGPVPKSSRLRYTVLDGQQRLTALYQAVYDKGPIVYTVTAAALESGSVDVLEEGVETHDRLLWDAVFRRRSWSENGERIPTYVLRSASHYFEWRDKVVNGAPADERDDLAARLSLLYRDSLEAFHRYKFPAVTVEADLEPTAISRIFERVNKTGMSLSTFDLMVARVYEPGWNLRVHWESARQGAALIDAFLGEDGMPVLQTIALAEVQNIRESAVLELPQTLVRNKWESAVEASEEALEFLLSSCGVLRPEWLPYRGMLLPLAALALEHDLDDYEPLLQKWFWSRSFALAFDAAANTRLVADYLTLKRSIEDSEELPVAPASADTLLNASRRRQGAIWRAFLCVLGAHRARDLSGDDLGFDDAAEHLQTVGSQIAVASVLPRSANVPPGTEPAHLRVLGLVVATRATARRVQQDYLETIVDEVADREGDEAVERTLRSQLLPPREDLESAEDHWEEFLETRLSRLAQFLRDEADQTVERSVD